MVKKQSWVNIYEYGEIEPWGMLPQNQISVVCYSERGWGLEGSCYWFKFRRQKCKCAGIEIRNTVSIGARISYTAFAIPTFPHDRECSWRGSMS